MQAFKVEMEHGGSFYFCSLECALKHNFGAAHGQFVLERDYPRQEPCANCDIFLNDTTRSFTHSVHCGQHDRDARILAESNIELLNALETLFDITPFATNDKDAEIRVRIRALIRKTIA
jgi:hypothetical protein